MRHDYQEFSDPDTWLIVVPHSGAPMRPHFWLVWDRETNRPAWHHACSGDLAPPPHVFEFDTLAEAMDNMPSAGPKYDVEVVSRIGWDALCVHTAP